MSIQHIQQFKAALRIAGTVLRTQAKAGFGAQAGTQPHMGIKNATNFNDIRGQGCFSCAVFPEARP